MASYDDNKRFREAIVGDLLDQSIDWIQSNMSPEDVFDSDSLIAFVRDNIDIDDVYPDATILEYINETCDPDDVFEDDELARWAEENGWMRKPLTEIP